PQAEQSISPRLGRVTVGGNYSPLIVAECCNSVSLFVADLPPVAPPTRGDHVIATVKVGRNRCLRVARAGRTIAHFKKTSGRRPHAEQGSDRSDSASKMRRGGNTGRGRHGRERQGGDLPGRVRQTRPVQGRSDDRG